MPPDSPIDTHRWTSHPSSPAPRTPTMEPDRPIASPDSSFVAKEKDDKLPHDASVFVGSLPSNIDQGDLTRMLMEHLSEHSQIKNIKVVRDSKGGVCAFVQCEDASSAALLIKTLHSSPHKPFMGRILRYEPARAFRTLLVSYRTPTQLFRPPGYMPPGSGSFRNQEIELDLPSAMRIWKHCTSRFHSILYNHEAIQSEEQSPRSQIDAQGQDSAFFLHPMKYEEETLRDLAAYFGPLEALNVFDVDNDGQTTAVDYTLYPPPHDAPRSPSMDSRCWEVKWEHRDDCVSALMTLRRVPHLTITWAHQPSAQNSTFQQSFRHIAGSPAYPFHVRSRIQTSQSFPPTLLGPQFRNPGYAFPRLDQAKPHAARQLYPAFPPFDAGGPLRESFSWADESTAMENTNAVDHENGVLDHNSSIKRHNDKGPISLAIAKRPNFTEGSEVKHTRVHSSPGMEAQDIYMPQTPALDASSITPVTPGSQCPITPTTSGTSYDGFGTKDDGHPFRQLGGDKDIDPTTLFVGGLEMSGPGAWDEEKIRNFFSRYSGMESVKVVRPANATAAFAFVKFNNPESPARAVYEEHNRVYEGRAMRVQLRDVNPHRHGWKFGRGRGRFPQGHFNSYRRFNHRPAFDDQHKHSVDSLQVGIPDSEAGNDPGIRLSSLGRALPSASNNTNMERRPRPEPTDPQAADSSTGTGVPINDGPDLQPYREWYDDLESPAHTPAPSSLGSSVSTTGVSYNNSPYPYMPNGSYLPPPPWMHAYPQAPYPIPYYPGYPSAYPPAPSLQTASTTSPPSSDASGSTPVSQPLWSPMGVYGSFIPYPVLPSRPPVVEHGNQAHTQTQAPLIPTGFIQNEQGTLIAVYQPEALNQYMGVSGGAPPTYVGQRNTMSQNWTPPASSRSYNHVPPVPTPQVSNRGPSNTSAFASSNRRFPDARLPESFRGAENATNIASSPFSRRSHGRNYQNFTRSHHSPNSQQPFHGNGRGSRGHTASLNILDQGQHGGQLGRVFGHGNR